MLPPFLTIAVWGSAGVEILFGTKWQTSGWILQVLAIQVFVYAIFYLSEPLLVAMGRTRDAFKIRLWQVSLDVAALLLAASFGFSSVIIAQTVAVFLAAPIMFIYVSRAINLDLRSLCTTLWKPFAFAGLFITVAFTLQLTMVNRFGLFGLMFSLTAAYCCYCGCFFLFARAELRTEAINMIRRFLPKS